MLGVSLLTQMEIQQFETSFAQEVEQTGWSCPQLLDLLDGVEDQLKLLEEYPQSTQPPREKIFRALRILAPNGVNVLILGQDPYPTPGDGMGYAFSVESKRIPPSLKNIFTELRNDGFTTPSQGGNLTRWIDQGVLLLNTCLTVRDGSARSTPNTGKNSPRQ